MGGGGVGDVQAVGPKRVGGELEDHGRARHSLPCGAPSWGAAHAHAYRHMPDTQPPSLKEQTKASPRLPTTQKLAKSLA